MRIAGNIGTHGYDPNGGWKPSGLGGGVHTWDLIYHGGTYHGSTIRVKENIRPLTGVLDRIEQLNPVQYDHRRPDDTQGGFIGFIAEEMHEVFPECVLGDDDFFSWGIKENTLHAVTIAGLQELTRKVKKLEHHIIGVRGQTRTQELHPPQTVEILRERVDMADTDQTYVTARFSAVHPELGAIETVRTLRVPAGIPRESFLRSERDRWLHALDADEIGID